MNVIIASKIGFGKTFVATLIAFALLEIIFLVIETRVDFANGVIFFLNTQLNYQFGIMLIIIFLLTGIFGGVAGKEIMIRRKNYVGVAIKYSLAIIFIVLLYIIIMIMIGDPNLSAESVQAIVAQTFSKTSFDIIIPIIIVWLIACWQIKLLSEKLRLS